MLYLARRSFHCFWLRYI